MSEVRLVVREAEKTWSGTIHGSCANRAIAALSADPRTFAELEAACRRFAKPDPEYGYLCNLRPSENDEPYDAGLVVIDLIARVVVVDSTYSSPGKRGSVEYHNGQCCTDKSLSYHLADDWHFSSEGWNWRATCDARRDELAGKPDVDARAVFYGRPLLEFIAKEMFAAFARRDEYAAAKRLEWIEQARKRLARAADISPDQVDASLLTEEEVTPKPWAGQEVYVSLYYDAIRETHVSWLLTPREELGGRSPREVALEKRDYINWDLEDRCHQWTTMGTCPPGLPESSHAFRFGGFGTHELVEYYHLVRELLWSCWDRLTEFAQTPEYGQLTVGDFVAGEIPRLEMVRDEWFDIPDPEMHGRTPRSIIYRERARLPEGVSGHDAIVDPDCPCCQMMADMPGPMFWHLDGSAMDDDFAFSLYHDTREEWEEEQRRWEEHSRKFDAEWAERKRLGVTDSTAREDGSNNVWSRSFFVNESADVPLGIRVFGFGCRLAELIVGLRSGEAIDSQIHIDRLNRDFGNLREVLQSSDASLAAALIEPVMDRFKESLLDVAMIRDNLAEQCESLVSSLDRLLDPPSETSWDSTSGDLPF